MPLIEVKLFDLRHRLRCRPSGRTGLARVSVGNDRSNRLYGTDHEETQCR